MICKCSPAVFFPNFSRKIQDNPLKGFLSIRLVPESADPIVNHLSQPFNLKTICLTWFQFSFQLNKQITLSISLPNSLCPSLLVISKTLHLSQNIAVSGRPESFPVNHPLTDHCQLISFFSLSFVYLFRVSHCWVGLHWIFWKESFHWFILKTIL